MSSEKELVESENEELNESEEEEESEEENDSENQDNRIPIDLSENEIYKGVCTLLEDEEGNNILEYISLLHTELIGINKSLENLRLIRKDITRLADCAELFLKNKKDDGVSSRKEEVSVKRDESSRSSKPKR